MHRVLDHLAAELSDLGLRQAEINVLAQLQPVRPRSVGELAAATGQRCSTLTGVLDRLRGAGSYAGASTRLTGARSRSCSRPAASAAARVHAVFATLDERVLADVPPSAAGGFHSVLDAVERHTKGTA